MLNICLTEHFCVGLGLFDRGVKDYLSVELWLEYCQHSIGGIGRLFYHVDSV